MSIWSDFSSKSMLRSYLRAIWDTFMVQMLSFGHIFVFWMIFHQNVMLRTPSEPRLSSQYRVLARFPGTRYCRFYDFGTKSWHFDINEIIGTMVEPQNRLESLPFDMSWTMDLCQISSKTRKWRKSDFCDIFTPPETAKHRYKAVLVALIRVSEHEISPNDMILVKSDQITKIVFRTTLPNHRIGLRAYLLKTIWPWIFGPKSWKYVQIDKIVFDKVSQITILAWEPSFLSCSGP